MRKVVVNTTPLIALAGIGRLELLHQLYGEIMIPDVVLREIESEPARSLVLKADWIQKRQLRIRKGRIYSKQDFIPAKWK